MGVSTSKGLISTIETSVSSAQPIIIPAISFVPGSNSVDFWIAVFSDAASISNSNITMSSSLIAVQQLPGISNLVVGRVSVPQLFEFPFSEPIRVLSTEVTILEKWNASFISQVMFGAGGLQSVFSKPSSIGGDSQVAGMHVSPQRDWFYASNYSYNYFLLVLPNTPTFKVC